MQYVPSRRASRCPKPRSCPLGFPATPSASPYVAIGRVDIRTSSPQTAVRRWDSSSAPGLVEPLGLGQMECRDFSFRPRASVSPPVSPVRADRCRQTVETLAHVGDAGRQPYPGARRQSVHRSSSITCRGVSELTSPRRRTRAPQPNTISIIPSRSVRCGRSLSGAISTGTIAPLSTAAFGNSCRRHRNSWLLFKSWRRATIDTDAPGTCVSATIWRFNASEYCRRFGCLVSTKPVVDTSSACSPSVDHCANPPSAAGAPPRVLTAQGLSQSELVRTSVMYSPGLHHLTPPHSTGPSPSG